MEVVRCFQAHYPSSKDETIDYILFSNGTLLCLRKGEKAFSKSYYKDISHLNSSSIIISKNLRIAPTVCRLKLLGQI